MTYEEAINSLKLNDNLTFTVQCDDEGIKKLKEVSGVAALEIAVKAIEKQIPKKPDYEGDGYDDNGNIIIDTAFCPLCHNMFEVDYDKDKKYCPECGQRLDWSEVET